MTPGSGVVPGVNGPGSVWTGVSRGLSCTVVQVVHKPRKCMVWGDGGAPRLVCGAGGGVSLRNRLC